MHTLLSGCCRPMKLTTWQSHRHCYTENQQQSKPAGRVVLINHPTQACSVFIWGNNFSQGITLKASGGIGLARNKYKNEESLCEGSRNFRLWEQRIGHALRNLGDRSALSQSPLARLSYIQRLAEERYDEHLLPRGLALRDILLASAQKVSTELSNEPGLTRACRYLDLLVKGLRCQEISRQLGLSREHTSRKYRKKAVALVTEEFIHLIGKHK